MSVLTLLNQKGGVSKTTLAISLACRWHLAGFKVAIIDADPQCSVMHWREVQEDLSKLSGIDVYKAENANDVREVKGILGDYDYIVVDTAGTDKHISEVALSVSDAALIPVQAGMFDIKASRSSLDLAISQGVKVAYCVTRVVSGSDLGDGAREVLEASKALVVKKMMRQYIAYNRAMNAGESVQTLFPGSVAAQNMEAVGQGVDNIFGWEKK